MNETIRALDNLLKEIERKLVENKGSPLVLEPYIEHLDELAKYGRKAQILSQTYNEIRRLQETGQQRDEARSKEKPALGTPLSYGELLLGLNLFEE